MKKYSFGLINNQDTEVSFNGEELSTDSGLILIDKINKKIELITKMESKTHDDPENIKDIIDNIISQTSATMIIKPLRWSIIPSDVE